MKSNNLLAYIWMPWIYECTGTVGNPAPNITANSKYAVQNIDISYYTIFNINENL